MEAWLDIQPIRIPRPKLVPTTTRQNSHTSTTSSLPAASTNHVNSMTNSRCSPMEHNQNNSNSLSTAVNSANQHYHHHANNSNQVGINHIGFNPTANRKSPT